MAMVTPYNKGTMIAFTFLMQMCFGWAQYESIAFTQLGVPQEELGISGGLAGVARYAGGSLASAVFTTVLTNAQTSRAAATVPKAAISLGMSPSNAQDLLTAIVTGSSSIEDIPGLVSQSCERLKRRKPLLTSDSRRMKFLVLRLPHLSGLMRMG